MTFGDSRSGSQTSESHTSFPTPRWPAWKRRSRKTLLGPERVVQSSSDPGARLYYRWYYGTRVGDEFVCVVVKFGQEEAFLLTSYLTDRIKRGSVLWPNET